MIDEYMQGNSSTENDETIPILQGGLQYNHYTDQEDKDYYAENETEEQCYTGDSMELAAEYKRKYDEEQKKKAEQQAQQNVSYQTNPQTSSANWIMPVVVGWVEHFHSTHHCKTYYRYYPKNPPSIKSSAIPSKSEPKSMGSSYVILGISGSALNTLSNSDVALLKGSSNAVLEISVS